MEHPQQCDQTQIVDVQLRLLPPKDFPEIVRFLTPPFFESTTSALVDFESPV